DAAAVDVDAVIAGHPVRGMPPVGLPVSGLPHGFLDIDREALAGDTLVIDGKVTDVPPGRQVPVLAGKHTVEIRMRTGGARMYIVDVTLGSHTTVPGDGDPGPRPPRPDKRTEK